MDEFEWDEDKRQKVLAERGFDLLDAALIFEGPVLIKPDVRKDCGEPGFLALGMADGDCFVVVYTPRRSAKRLITAWRGGDDERVQYQKGVFSRASGDEDPRRGCPVARAGFFGKPWPRFLGGCRTGAAPDKGVGAFAR